MDNEEGECFDVSFAKARAKNVVESNILHKHLKIIDRQCHRSICRIECDLKEERRFAYRLKRDAKRFRKKDKVFKDKVDEKMAKHRKSGGDIPRKIDWNDWGQDKVNVERKDDEISVTGFKMIAELPPQPKMFFWSQDASTKLPVMSSFYGYRLSLPRSMTEIKLLGQQMYSNANRDTQSADVMYTRSTSFMDMRRVKTSGMPGEDFEDELCFDSFKLAPPPTRENTNLSELRAISELPTSAQSFLNDSKGKENTARNVSETPLKEKLIEKNSVVKNAWEANPREKSFINEPRPKTFKREQTIEKDPPQNINLDMKTPDSPDKLPLLPQRTAGTTSGKVRPATRKKPVKLKIRTREEATREYQELISSRSTEKPKIVKDVKESYSHVPKLQKEINKIKTSIEIPRRVKSSQYSKSVFAENMQTAISKKVFSKENLPMPFRKNGNTMLKHYGAPIMAVKTSKVVSNPFAV